MTIRRLSWLFVLAAAGLLTYAILAEAWPWMVDDAFISLRYSERLVEGHGLTWTDGEYVEGYSNLSWVLAIAGLGWLGVDYVFAARALGVLCTLGTVLTLVFGLPGRWPSRLAVVVLGSLTSTAIWTIGGLEAPLAMLCIALALVALARARQPESAPWRSHLWAGLALALLVLTRPDGPLWTVLATFAVVGWPGLRGAAWLTAVRRALPIGLPPLLAFLGQLAFRLAYYDDWVPNTAHVKADVTSLSLRAGRDYLISGALSLRALLLPAALGAVAALVRRTPTLVMALLGVVCWSLYVAFVGGDPLPCNRMLVPMYAPLTVLAAHGLHVLASIPRAGHTLAVLAAVACVVLARIDANPRADDPRQHLTTWEWEGEFIGPWLAKHFGRYDPLVAVDAAGSVPFFSKLRSLDMLGLCDRTIAKSPPAPPEDGFWAGHTHGNGVYVLDRQPDLVLFGADTGSPQPAWLSGRQMEVDPRFVRDYRLALWHTGPAELRTGPRDDFLLNAWLRAEGRLGYDTSQPRIELPAYLLGSYRQPYAFRYRTPPTPEHENFATWTRDFSASIAWWKDPGVVGVPAGDEPLLVAEVRKPGRHDYDELHLQPGSYRIALDGAPDGVTASLQHADGSPLPQTERRFEIAADTGPVDLVVDVPAATPLPFHIRHIWIERAPE